MRICASDMYIKAVLTKGYKNKTVPIHWMIKNAFK